MHFLKIIIICMLQNKHASIVSSESMIALEVCTKKGCCKGQVHCPLCQGVILPPDLAQDHVKKAHMNEAVHTQDGLSDDC